MSGPGRIFTLAQAREALPLVRSLTEEARRKLSELTSPPNETAAARIIAEWASCIEEAGATVKGPWLVDFDSGAGFYCWKWPEETLDFFHGYEEGFGGRLPLQ